MENIFYCLTVFCYILVAYGACNVIAFSDGPFYIFSKIREWAYNINSHFGKMFSCMICLPANFGWICSLLNLLLISTPFAPFNIIFNSNVDLWYLILLCDGAFTTGIVYLIYIMNEYFEKKINYFEENDNNVYIDEEENNDVFLVEDITKNKKEINKD